MMNVPVLCVSMEELAKMAKGRLAAYVHQPTKEVHVKVRFSYQGRNQTFAVDEATFC